MTKETKPNIFLGGECPEDNAWRKELKAEFADKYMFIDPFDKEWDATENIYTELANASTADFALFYRGGEGTVKEKEFLDTIGIPYEEFEDLEEVYEYLDTLPALTYKTLPAGSVITLEGIPVQLQDSVTVTTTEGNMSVIEELSTGTQVHASMEHSYGCLMVPVPHFVRTYLLSEFLAKSIDPALLNTDEAMHGIEPDTHITLLYGLEEPVCAEAHNALGEVSPVTITTGSKVAYFDNKDTTVAYVPVDSVELEELHYRLATELPNADKHPVYTPHITLAYLKPGSRLDNENLESFTFKTPMVLISYPDGSVAYALMTNIDLKDLANWMINPE